jgi:hypothetical protein
MSGDGFFYKGLELIRLRGHPKFYNFARKYIGTPELANAQIKKVEQIGTKVGLEPSEVRVALAASLGNPGFSPRLLAYILLIILIVIVSIVGIWIVYWGTYPPGTLYDALAPHDFD